MILKVGNNSVDFFNDINVTLEYNTVASTFSFTFYFNPINPKHKAICKPLSYANVTVEHDGETLITGTLLNVEFNDSAVKELCTISGYSNTGVFEDCEIPKSAYPLQSDGISLKAITEKIIKPFGIKLVVDSKVASRADSKYVLSKGSDTQSIKSYLSDMAGQKNIILTHDESGNLVFTEAKTSQTPIYDFGKGMVGVLYTLSANGQAMHSDLLIHRQVSKKNPNPTNATQTNPYVSVFRPRINRQSSGDATNTSFAARNILSDELRNIKLTIEVDRWSINGKIIRPNNIISILNEDLYIYKRTNFFIESVSFKGDNERETATLTCVLPEVYNNQTPKNVFD